MNKTELIIKLVDAKHWAEDKFESMKSGTISRHYYSGYVDGLQLSLNHIAKTSAGIDDE